MDHIRIRSLRCSGWKIECWEMQDFSTFRAAVLEEIGLGGEFADCFYFVSNGRNLQCGDVVEGNRPCYLLPRLLGGKGGFGSMLRAIGAQIEKTTNREACRDLSGRRLRDINEEMRLKKWIAKQSEREQERAARRRERLEKRLAEPKHEFHDPEYEKNMSELSEKVNDALSEGLARGKSEIGSKRSATGTMEVVHKKRKFGLGFGDIDSEEDSDEAGSAESEQQSCSSDSTSEVLPVPVDDSVPSTSKEVKRRLDPPQDHNLVPDGIVLTESSELKSTLETNEPAGSEENRSGTSHGDVMCAVPKSLDLNNFTSVKELEKLGLERLKLALMAVGLKCGGTLKQRAERLFSVKGLDPDEICHSLFAVKRP